MKYFRHFVFVLLVMPCAFGQSTHQSFRDKPETLVASLYQQVVVHHPGGLIYGANRKIFAPYLSKMLLHKIDLASACSRDWLRQTNGHADGVPIKAPFGWAESGIFSGSDERTGPNTFSIEKTDLKPDGSFRIEVKLSLVDVPPEIWRVAVIGTREDGHFVVDDVIYLQDKDNHEYRLSESLALGCDGAHWVGYRDQSSGIWIKQ